MGFWERIRKRPDRLPSSAPPPEQWGSVAEISRLDGIAGVVLQTALAALLAAAGLAIAINGHVPVRIALGVSAMGFAVPSGLAVAALSYSPTKMDLDDCIKSKDKAAYLALAFLAVVVILGLGVIAITAGVAAADGG